MNQNACKDLLGLFALALGRAGDFDGETLKPCNIAVGPKEMKSNFDGGN